MAGIRAVLGFATLTGRKGGLIPKLKERSTESDVQLHVAIW